MDCNTNQEELELYSEEIAKILGDRLRRVNTILMIISSVFIICTISLLIIITMLTIKVDKLSGMSDTGKRGGCVTCCCIIHNNITYTNK